MWLIARQREAADKEADEQYNKCHELFEQMIALQRQKRVTAMAYSC